MCLTVGLIPLATEENVEPNVLDPTNKEWRRF
jgi:hypothetical protein